MELCAIGRVNAADHAAVEVEIIAGGTHTKLLAQWIWGRDYDILGRSKRKDWRLSAVLRGRRVGIDLTVPGTQGYRSA